MGKVYDRAKTYAYRKCGLSKEIDLIYAKPGEIYPIEIKKSVSPGKKATKNFSVLSKFHMTIKPGLVIDTCTDILPINESAYYYPVFRIGE